MVLLLLGVIWAAVLVPPWLQNRREARPTASIRSFHRQLWLLERTSPGYAAPVAGSGPRARFNGGSGSGVTVYGDDYSDDGYAYGHGHGHAYGGYDDHDHDLDDDDAYAYDDEDFDDAGDLVAPAGPGPLNGAGVNGVAVNGAAVNGVERADRVERVGRVNGFHGPDGADRLDATDGAGEFDGLDGMDPRAGARWAELAEARRQRLAERSPAELRRRAQGYRRRRRVLSVLLIGALVTAPPAAFLGGTTWWAVHAVADVLLVSYVALLVQRQRRAVEREEKVHYLAPIRAPRPAVVVLHGGAVH